MLSITSISTLQRQTYPRRTELRRNLNVRSSPRTCHCPYPRQVPRSGTHSTVEPSQRNKTEANWQRVPRAACVTNEEYSPVTSTCSSRVTSPRHAFLYCSGTQA